MCFRSGRPFMWGLMDEHNQFEAESREWGIPFHLRCLAPEFLDSELSVFMQQLRVQGAAGGPGLA